MSCKTFLFIYSEHVNIFGHVLDRKTGTFWWLNQIWDCFCRSCVTLGNVFEDDWWYGDLDFGRKDATKGQPEQFSPYERVSVISKAVTSRFPNVIVSRRISVITSLGQLKAISYHLNSPILYEKVKKKNQKTTTKLLMTFVSSRVYSHVTPGPLRPWPGLGNSWKWVSEYQKKWGERREKENRYISERWQTGCE